MDWRHLYELTTAGRRNGLALKNLVVWTKESGSRRHSQPLPSRADFVAKVANLTLWN